MLRSRRRRRLEAWPQTRGRPHGSRRFAPHHEGGSRAATLSTNPLRSDEQAGMNRRAFLTLIGGAASAWPLAARAQQPSTPVVGYVHSDSPQPMVDLLAAFREGLGETGYVEGQNVTIEYRWAQNDLSRIPELVGD